MPIPPLFFPLSALLGIASLAYALLNFQLLRGLARLARPRNRSSSRPTVSILIAARNEEARIVKTLDCLLAQDYPPEKLQIIVVDDRSEDATAAILAAYAAKTGGRLEWVSIHQSSPGFSPKKYALSQGLLIAHGEIIVTTDADCIMTGTWVSSLASEFREDTGLVLGMTTYDRKDGGWIEGTAALEFFSYGVVAAALVGLNFPVNGNANNIAYRRKVYDLSSGFAGHGRIVSGDDDFLIQSIHALGKWEVRYSTLPGSQVRTEPPGTFGHFWEQRKRWASKCSLYQPKQVAFLGAIFAYYCAIALCLAAGLFWRPLLCLGALTWAIKTGTDFLVMRKGGAVFSKRELLRYFVPTALIHIPLIIAAVFSGSFGRFTWKGQTTGKRVKAK